MQVNLAEGLEIPRDDLLRHLVEIQYERNDIDFHRGTFRVRGDTVEIFPAYEEDRAVRIEFFGDTIEAISWVDPLRGKKLMKVDKMAVYPGAITSRPGTTSCGP
jgi:excinuclease ABC subunit B